MVRSVPLWVSGGVLVRPAAHGESAGSLPHHPLSSRCAHPWCSHLVAAVRRTQLHHPWGARARVYCSRGAVPGEGGGGQCATDEAEERPSCTPRFVLRGSSAGRRPWGARVAADEEQLLRSGHRARCGVRCVALATPVTVHLSSRCEHPQCSYLVAAEQHDGRQSHVSVPRWGSGHTAAEERPSCSPRCPTRGSSARCRPWWGPGCGR